MSNGWDQSAQAWIAVIGDDGDWGRRFVLDPPMIARAVGRGFRDALDLGCGEGRFCRMLGARGLRCAGIDPAAALIDRARALDAAGDYRVARAEALPFDAASFDLVVSYLSLIDIDDVPAAIAEARRVLRPGGTFLIANLQPFNSAAVPLGWTREPDGSRRFCIDHYLEVRETWAEWRGIRIRNWHRPLHVYLQALLGAGFNLVHFDEPAPVGVDDDKADRYRRVPNFLLMEWCRAG
jgi:SAM-dependent methyltransferase